MSQKQSGYTFLAIDGVENCMSALKDISEGKLSKCFIEMSACIGSCIGGPVMEKYHSAPVRDYIAISEYAGTTDFDVHQPENSLMKKQIAYIDKKLKLPGELEITSILHKMGKNKSEDELNCGSCGYNTCREKAVAIFQGKAEVSMCLPFLKERAENFSDNIINNSPNGIIVLNENLEVQQINKAALTIMNLQKANDVMGEQVIRILEPKIFIDARDQCKDIHNQQVFLAEYNRYVEQTVIFDRDYKILICIMRDVTDEETQRIKKETISRKTIEIADKVVDKQMRIVQEIASLLGETAAETKIALTKLKESIADE